MLFFCLLLALVLSLSGLAQANEVKAVEVFQGAPIQFGDAMTGSTWEALDQGRIIRRTLELPNFNGPVKITARVKLESAGDPWDRFGTVYLLPQTGPAVELLKFMTGFGTGLPYKRDDIPDHPSVDKWAEYSLWEADVTHLAPLLQGTVTIEAIIDTWVNPGWLLDFTLLFEPAEDERMPDWTMPVFNNTGEYWTKEVFASEASSFEVEIPPGLESLQMFYLTSGHGGRSSGDEFNKKDHIIYVDDQEVLRFVPWREDGPLFRPFSPTSAKWEGDVWSSDLSRSNWIPGDQVKPMVFELGEHLKAGRHKISLAVTDMAESTPDNLNYWNISIVLVGYRQSPRQETELVPLLQAPNPSGITISWVHNSDYASVVEYGPTESLGQRAWGNTELIGGELVWHTVHLRGLSPDTTYYYRVRSGLSESTLHQFQTPPAPGDKTAVLVGLAGAAADPEGTKLILSSLKDEVKSRGENLQIVLQMGNLLQNTCAPGEYLTQVVEPFSAELPGVPVHIVPGSQERESIYLYQFVHNDAFDDYLPTSSYGDRHGRLGEETYQFRLGRTMFLVFNTNVLNLEGLTWLEKAVARADQDQQIDSLIVLTHQPVDSLSSYVQGRIKTHLSQTNKPTLLLDGEQIGGSRFALLKIEGEAVYTLDLYEVDLGTGKVQLLQDK